MTFIVKLLWSKFKKFVQKKIQQFINSKAFLSIVMFAIGVSYTVNYYEAKPLWMDYQSALEAHSRIIVIANEVQAATVEEIEMVAEAKEDPKSEVKTGMFSAYNAEPAQTDGDPMTMASGKKVFEGAVANNCLPFGTKVTINGKVYEVQDRMNSRYGCDHFDIFMWSYQDAIKFGRKTLEYSIQ